MPPKKSAKGTTKREHAPQKRLRAAANRKAKRDAIKYAVPAIAVVFIAIAVFFFCRYGLGKQIAARISKATGRR